MSGKKRSTQKWKSSWILPVVGGASILGGLGALLYLTRKAETEAAELVAQAAADELAEEQEAQAQAAAELVAQQQAQAQAAAELVAQQQAQAQAAADELAEQQAQAVAAELAEQQEAKAAELEQAFQQIREAAELVNVQQQQQLQAVEPEDKAIPSLECDAKSVLGPDIVDATTGLQFRVIDEGPKGKGVMYIQRTQAMPKASTLSNKFKSKHPLSRYGQKKRQGAKSRLHNYTIRAGEKLCYFHGQVLEKGTEEYQEAMQGWKKHYVVELEGSLENPNRRILAPNVNEPKDVTDVGFLVNTGLAKDINCWITQNGDKAWWVATKNIYTCTPLVGRYYRGAIRDIQKGTGR